MEIAMMTTKAEGSVGWRKKWIQTTGLREEKIQI